MNFYFFAYTALGVIATNNAWYLKMKRGFSGFELSQWMITSPYLEIITAFTNVALLLALATSLLKFGVTYLLYSTGEVLLGAFLSGFVRGSPFGALLVILSVPIFILLPGSFWGFWFIAF